jgi:hypothetical protein
MLVVEGNEYFVDVSGLTGHQENCDGLCCHQNKGPVIAIFHQMALLVKGKIILFCVQMEPISVIHPSVLTSSDRYQILLDYHNGLPNLQCRPPTKFQHIMTSGVDVGP